MIGGKVIPLKGIAAVTLAIAHDIKKVCKKLRLDDADEKVTVSDYGILALAALATGKPLNKNMKAALDEIAGEIAKDKIRKDNPRASKEKLQKLYDAPYDKAAPSTLLAVPSTLAVMDTIFSLTASHEASLGQLEQLNEFCSLKGVSNETQREIYHMAVLQGATGNIAQLLMAQAMVAGVELNRSVELCVQTLSLLNGGDEKGEDPKQMGALLSMVTGLTEGKHKKAMVVLCKDETSRKVCKELLVGNLPPEADMHKMEAMALGLGVAPHAVGLLNVLGDGLDAFMAVDSDGSGELSPEEVKAVFQMQGIEMNDAEFGEIILKMDEDLSGEIDRKEFTAWLASGDELASKMKGKLAGVRAVGILTTIAGLLRVSPEDTMKIQRHATKAGYKAMQRIDAVDAAAIAAAQAAGGDTTAILTAALERSDDDIPMSPTGEDAPTAEHPTKGFSAMNPMFDAAEGEEAPAFAQNLGKTRIPRSDAVSCEATVAGSSFFRPLSSRPFSAEEYQLTRFPPHRLLHAARDAGEVAGRKPGHDGRAVRCERAQDAAGAGRQSAGRPGRRAPVGPGLRGWLHGRHADVHWHRPGRVRHRGVVDRCGGPLGRRACAGAAEGHLALDQDDGSRAAHHPG